MNIMIKNCQKFQEEQIDNLMKGRLSTTVENMGKLYSDYRASKPIEGGGVCLNGEIYEDYDHLISTLIDKYYEKE